MAKATAIIFTFFENLAQMAHTDWDPDSNGNLYPFRQLRDNVVFNYPAYQTWIIYFYHCLTNHYTLLLRHVSTIRQGDFWKLFIVITPKITENSTKLFETCSALLNMLLEHAYQILLGLVEIQLSYDFERLSVSTITTYLLLSRKE